MRFLIKETATLWPLWFEMTIRMDPGFAAHPIVVMIKIS